MRYPFGSATPKFPSVFKLAFKAGAGAYLGWQVATFADRMITAVFVQTVGEVDQIAGKIIDKVVGKKS